MDSQTIQTALGVLQADPDSQEAWSRLAAEVGQPGGDLSASELLRLLDAARAQHNERGEFDAVAALLALEAQVADGTADEPRLLEELAKVASSQLFDDQRAIGTYRRVLELIPGYPGAEAALGETLRKLEQRQELLAKYLGEAEGAADEAYKASMLMRAAELEVCFGDEQGDLAAATERLEQAVRLDPTNERAGQLLEQIYRRAGKFEEVARVLERLADRGADRAQRTAAGVRLARVYALKLQDTERAVRAYERVLRDTPNHGEAMSFLTEAYSATNNWNALVALYERDLGTREHGGEQLGDMLQIAILHWRKRGRPDDADPWFQRIARENPAHDAVLEFYREYCAALDDDPRLHEILLAARAVSSDPAKLAGLQQELAAIAERQRVAQTEIERCKSVLRGDPDDASAREGLKRLYKQTKGHNALLDLLRQQLERTAPEDYAGRSRVLREVAAIYRQYNKSETALVSVLNQIVQLDDKLDEHDVEELRELVGLYAKLERWRDLVTHQLKLADVSPDLAERIALYRDAGRRWLEQFSNAQNAADAYSKLLKLDPRDAEARQRLEELYRKRRAWGALYELYESELGSLEGAPRLSLMKEMARLAAESLNRSADAIRLYKEIVRADSGRVDVLDALERHAERAKDWHTVAEALEHRIRLLQDPEAKVAALQRLGRVYSDQLKEHDKSAATWQGVLEIEPGNHRALRVLRDAYLKAADFEGLQKLYASQNDWEGLAEVLSNTADRTTDLATKIELSYRAAAIFENQLSQPDRAFRSYERVLAADPADTRAARALVPLYEADDKWARLPALYETLLAAAEDTPEKLQLLKRLVFICGEKLNDRRAQITFARRAYELEPAQAESLDLLERASREAERWDQYIEALEQRLKGLSDAGERSAPAASAAQLTAEPKGKRGKRRKRGSAKDDGLAADEITSSGSAYEQESYDLLRRLARVQDVELANHAGASEVYRRIIALDPTDEAALNSLENILRRVGEWEQVRELLRHREAHAKDVTERIAVLKNWADFEEAHFGAVERAAELFRGVLELDPTDRHALNQLPRLLLGLGDADAASRVVEAQRDQLEGAERIECELQLAELYLVRLGRGEAAFEAAVRVLNQRSDARAMSVLARLMEVPATAARAAQVLAQHYAAGGDARQEAHALTVLLAATTEPATALALVHRLATVYEEKLNAYGSALDVVLKAAGRFPDEHDLWDRAEVLAAAAGRPTDLAETLRETLRAELSRSTEVALCLRAANLYEEKLGDPIGATPYLQRVLVYEPGHEQAFERLKVTLTAAERWSELEQLYDRAAGATDDLARRAEMLVEVALITEEIMDGADKAVRYYERVLEVDENHEIAMRALDRIYARLGQNDKLARLLEQRILTETGDTLLELKLRAAKLELSLHEPERALVHVEDVIAERLNDYEARTLAEQMLEIGNLRARAAKLLEGVYEARNETRDLVRVLEIRLADIDQSPVKSEEQRALRLELLRRIAMLRDERMHDDVGALEALARLVPEDPLDLDARERLLEVGQRLNARERLAEVLSQAASRVTEPVPKGEILMRVAGLYQELLAPDKAELTYRSILKLDENDPELLLPAARAIEAICIATNRPEELAEMLRLQVRFEYDDDRRRELLGRLGELFQAVLGDNASAIEAWKARLEESPSDEKALSALDRLYVASEKWPELVGILERRAEASADAKERKAFLLRVAETQEQQLGRVSEAVETYQSILDQFGLDAALLNALEALLAAAGRWQELADAFDRHLDIADSDAERLRLLAALGELRHKHLSDSDGAFEAFRRALEIDRGHASTRAALEALLASSDVAVRRTAAETLRPVYEAEQDHGSILRVLEIQASTNDDPLARLEVLETLIKVARDALQDAPRAFEYAKRAVREAVGHAELAPWLGHLDALASATGQRVAQVTLLREIVDEIFEGDVQLGVTLKIAELARADLADLALARQYYEKALELRSDDRTALVALEALFEQAGASRELHDILVRRIEIAENDRERKALMHRRGGLLADVLADKRQAIQVYESILDFDLDATAVRALEALYPEVEAWVELIHLYQRQLDAGAADPAELHVKIARVASLNQKDLARAFDELEQALALKAQHPEVIAELERLLATSEEREDRGRAASLLEPVYTRRSDFAKLMTALQARLEASTEADERRVLLTRLAKLYEEQHERYDAALETIAKLLHDDISDEWTIGELERLAKVAGASRRLAEIYAGEIADLDADDSNSARLARRAGEIFTGLGQLEQGLKWYRRALGFEPENRALFDAIDDILTQMGAHEERVALYRANLEHRYDAGERLHALHTIAGLLRDSLGRSDDAIETLKEALDVDDMDQRALDALGELYTARERWHDLADLYKRRAEGSQHADVAAGFRLALAKVYRERLDDMEQAIDQLEEIVRELTAHAEAIEMLEGLLKSSQHKQRVVDILRPLYESADDWRRLIVLNEDRFRLATSPGDKVAVLRETAELWERRGGDRDRARRALGAAIRIDAEDADVRAEFERLTGLLGAWDQLAQLYEDVLRAAPEILSRGAMLATLANVHNVHRDDPRQALHAFDRLRAEDESDIEPLNHMERLATLLSDWPTLVRVLTAKAELVLDDAERASIWRRIAEAKRDMLEDADGAVEAYEKAFELDPNSAFTADCLIALYENKGAAGRLVELYQARVDLAGTDEQELTYELLMRAATAYSGELGERRQAIDMLTRALDARSGDATALIALDELYRAEGLWSELLDNLRLRAELARDLLKRAELRKEIGAVLAGKLENYDEALDAYQMVLSELPGDDASIKAVRSIGENHEQLRFRVAEILIPTLEQTGRCEEWVDVLEMRLSVESDPADRAKTLCTQAQVLERQLVRPQQALRAVLRAIAERPESLEVHAEAERLAEVTGDWAGYAGVLSERAQSTFDPDVACDMYVRLGQIWRDKLAQREKAVEAYTRALEQAGDQPELLAALDELYSKLGKHEALSDILERRILVQTSQSEQAELFYRLATLQVKEFDDKVRALASLREALERMPEYEEAARSLEALLSERDLFEEASEVLEQVYRQRNQLDKLVQLLEKRVAFADTPEGRLEYRRQLARVLEDERGLGAEALNVLEQALAEHPEDFDLLNEVERLAIATSGWVSAAGALRKIVDARTDLAPGVAVQLCLRAAVWLRDSAHDDAGAEQCLLRALEFERENDEIWLQLEALQRVPGREADLIVTLRRRATLHDDIMDKEELYRRAKALADAQGDRDTAEAIVRDVLAVDDANAWALAELTRIRQAAGDFNEAFELLTRQADLAVGDASPRELRLRAARLAQGVLANPAKALALYEQLFEDDPTEREAADALGQLYAQLQRWDALRAHLSRLIDIVETSEERAKLRIELARMCLARFNASDDAIELLRAVLDEDPNDADAVVALSELYEKHKRDDDLAELLTGQIAAAQARNDAAVELKLQVRLGEVYESRLADPVRAIDTFRSVLDREPNHVGVLRSLVRLYRQQGDAFDAAQCLERLFANASGDELTSLGLELASIYDELGDVENAVRVLERCLSATPSRADIRSRLEQIYRNQESWAALAPLLAAGAEFAEGPAAQAAILEAAAALALERLEDPAQAAELLDRACKLQPDNRELLLKLCDAYTASGRAQAAVEVLERIVESFGKRRSKELGDIHRRLADAYLSQGNSARALEELDHAFRIEPGNVAVLKLLGEVALENGDHKKAQQVFRALLLQKLDDKSPISKAQVFMRLGQVHAQLDEKPKAIQMLERAIQTDATLDEARHMLDSLKAG